MSSAVMGRFACSVAVSVFVLVACCHAQGGSVKPPVLPNAFYGQFTEYDAPLTAPPPYINGVPQPPFSATRGQMYYDWTNERMIENRTDFCVNIFYFGNDFPCTFHNVDKISYLITYNKTKHLPPCCVFGMPWHPPRPDFLRTNVSATLYSKTPWDCGMESWFEIPAIAPPTGPFFYSFKNDFEETQVYRSFSFPGIDGWVQQNFHDVVEQPPSDAVWDLPEVCNKGVVPNCHFFGVDEEKLVKHFHRRF